MLQSVWDDMLDDLMQRLRTGKITKRSIEGQRRSKYRREKRAKRELANVLSGVAKRGTDLADQEMGSAP